MIKTIIFFIPSDLDIQRVLIKNMLKSIKEHSWQFSKEIWDQIFIEIVHQVKKRHEKYNETQY